LRVLEGEKGPLCWMNFQLNDFDEVLKTFVKSFGFTWDRTGFGVIHNGAHIIPKGILCGFLRFLAACFYIQTSSKVKCMRGNWIKMSTAG
jgi:hypothetical protein